jgi:hypothetical protein
LYVEVLIIVRAEGFISLIMRGRKYLGARKRPLMLGFVRDSGD